MPAFSTGPPVSFTFAPPSSQFVVIWSQKTIAFGRLDETGIYVTKIFHKMVGFDIATRKATAEKTSLES